MEEPTQRTRECVTKNSTPIRISLSLPWKRPIQTGTLLDALAVLIALIALFK